jgi:AraC-like DNA-binding protein
VTPLVRAVTLTGYAEVAAYVGLDAYQMLRLCRISRDSLDDPEKKLPASSVVELLEQSASRSGRSDFGLLLAQCRTFASLGPVSLLLEHLPTMWDVVNAITEHRHQLNDILVLGIEKGGTADMLKIELMPKYTSRQACALTLGVALIALRGASRRGWSPQSVHFTHAVPSHLNAYKRFFPAPVQFESHFNGFTSTHDALTGRMPWANDTMAAHARRLLELVPRSLEASATKESVSRSIILLLPSGDATLAQVAANLATSERTLQRELEKEGVGFAALLSEARRELAMWYLGYPEQSITSIAELLGYASLSSFTRWFTEEFGLSPRAWRDSELIARRRMGPSKPPQFIQLGRKRETARSREKDSAQPIKMIA